MDIQDRIVSHFPEIGEVKEILPLTSGLINQTYWVKTMDPEEPDYVLQRINHQIFTDVDMLQRNIDLVTSHIRKRLQAQGVTDLDRKVLRFLKTDEGKNYIYDEETGYWRVSVYIQGSKTMSEVTPESSYLVGLKFGEFEAMLADIPETLGDTIPNFHNMEFRLQQLRDAVAANPAGRLQEVSDLVEAIEKDAEEMCLAERLYREGKLPKRICHCDTKVSNMLFDMEDNVLCVIDLDTVMPNFVCSDVGDFLRSAANTAPEDEPDLDKIAFRMDVFRSFIRGYLESARCFLTDQEIALLSFSATLFPYMQAVRFLTDYINGDTYYQIQYPTHNCVRAKAQFDFYQKVRAKRDEMEAYIASLLK